MPSAFINATHYADIDIPADISSATLQTLLTKRQKYYASIKASTEDASTGVLCLGFYIGIQRYAIPITDIETVFEVTALTLLPKTSAHIAGLVAYKSKPLAVLNLKAIFSLSNTGLADTNHIIVLNGDRPTGILADRIDSVFNFTHTQTTQIRNSAALINDTAALFGDNENRVLLQTQALLRFNPFFSQSTLTDRSTTAT